MPAAACLSRFVFMMRKHEISPTAVDINWRSKVAVNHGTALRMPTRTSLSPWTRPAGLTGLCSLPKGKIKRVALLGKHRVQIDHVGPPAIMHRLVQSIERIALDKGHERDDPCKLDDA